MQGGAAQRDARIKWHGGRSSRNLYRIAGGAPPRYRGPRIAPPELGVLAPGHCDRSLYSGLAGADGARRLLRVGNRPPGLVYSVNGGTRPSVAADRAEAPRLAVFRTSHRAPGWQLGRSRRSRRTLPGSGSSVCTGSRPVRPRLALRTLVLRPYPHRRGYLGALAAGRRHAGDASCAPGSGRGTARPAGPPGGAGDRRGGSSHRRKRSGAGRLGRRQGSGARYREDAAASAHPGWIGAAGGCRRDRPAGQHGRLPATP